MTEKTAPQKLHERLADLIGSTQPGKKLPSEPNLAKRFAVSRATLREAMRTFETRGLLDRRQGIGTFVIPPNPVIESGLEMLESLETLAERNGLSVTIGDLSIKEIPADERSAKVLELDPYEKVICLCRTILSDEKPIAYLVDILRQSNLTSQEVSQGFTGSVLDLLLTKGDVLLESSRCNISARAADEELAAALSIVQGDPILCFESILYTKDHKPIDYSFSYFLPGYFNFHVLRRVGYGSNNNQ
jgi:GntR family transcriptional regulator